MQLQQETTQLKEGAKLYRNAFHCAYEVARLEGIRGLYRGFSASILGLSESTLQFVTYEYLKNQRLQSLRTTTTNPDLKTLPALETFVNFKTP
jgi:solute carrier family 25 protein 33/36